MLALDANILVRAALGKRVRKIIETYAGLVRFLVADTVVEEAQRHVPAVLTGRSLDPRPAVAVLDLLIKQLEIIEADVYRSHEDEARERLKNRDADDWPTVAVALTFDCAVWTEDADFFGTGIATWTTDRVEIFLRSLGT